MKLLEGTRFGYPEESRASGSWQTFPNREDALLNHTVRRLLCHRGEQRQSYQHQFNLSRILIEP
jgi:hypothetical protein